MNSGKIAWFHAAWNKQVFLEAGLVFKLVFAVLEIAGGALVYFISGEKITNLVLFLTQHELGEDPGDFFANYLLTLSSGPPLSRSFFFLYLVLHGVIKMVVITGVFSRKKWAYPAAIIVFSSFIIFEIFSLIHHHSFWVLFVAMVDIAVIALIVNDREKFSRTGDDEPEIDNIN